MRAKFIFATLVGLLCCSLATLEITELFELTDDTSNDFSLVGTQQASSAVVPQSLALQPKTNSTTDTERPTARHTYTLALLLITQRMFSTSSAR